MLCDFVYIFCGVRPEHGKLVATIINLFDSSTLNSHSYLFIINQIKTNNAIFHKFELQY